MKSELLAFADEMLLHGKTRRKIIIYSRYEVTQLYEIKCGIEHIYGNIKLFMSCSEESLVAMVYHLTRNSMVSGSGHTIRLCHQNVTDLIITFQCSGRWRYEISRAWLRHLNIGGASASSGNPENTLGCERKFSAVSSLILQSSEKYVCPGELLS